MARRSATVLPPRGRKGWHGRAPSPRRRKRGGGWLSPIMVVLPLAAFTAVFLWDGPPRAMGVEASAAAGFAGLPRGWDADPAALDAQQPAFGSAATARAQASSGDPERARFAACSGPVRINCVVDGDTFWYGGEKIRIAGLNAPEVSEPQCAREAALGLAASERLTELLNAGPFTLEPADQETDRYGRRLRRVTRAGESLGATLEAEGLAVEGGSYRGGWC